jgi:choline dehydrogenase-like flavoprotein
LFGDRHQPLSALSGGKPAFVSSGVVSGNCFQNKSMPYSSETDLVIVGAGTAGCALAHRILETTSMRVVLVEAGPRYPAWALGAPLAGLRLRKAWSWRHRTTPQSGLDGRRIALPMGRVVGGTSSVNAMVAAPGPASDFDEWGRLGCRGWSEPEVSASLEFFRSTISAPVLPVSEAAFESPFSTAFLEAAEQAGLRRVTALTGDQSQTCGMFPVFQKGGVRSSSALIAERLMGHPRFRLIAGRKVLKVLIHRNRACGVELVSGSRSFPLRAGAGVVLAAGALQSPVLLQLSGIGPANLLRSAGIEVQVDLCGVGERLQDHLGAPVVFRSNSPSPGRKSLWIPAAARWLWNRSGVMASNCCEAGCFLGAPPLSPVGEIFTHFQTARHPRAVELMCALLQPRSRGSVRINPSDPWGAPLLDPAYLDDPADAEAMRQIIQTARWIGSQPALRKFGLSQELLPGGQEIEAFLRSHATTCHHPVGSCRMGVGSASVVGPDLKVHGVEQLWVVDNSITPVIPRGHTASTALIIAAHGGRIISTGLGGSAAS